MKVVQISIANKDWPELQELLQKSGFLKYTKEIEPVYARYPDDIEIDDDVANDDWDGDDRSSDLSFK